MIVQHPAKFSDSATRPVLPPRRASAKTHAKRLLGRMLFPAATARWQNFVQHDDMLREQAGRHPVLTSKIYRPYLSSQLGCAQRVDALIGHYRFIGQRGLTGLVRRAAMHDIDLASIQCKSGEIATIQLSAIHEGHREGELALKLRYRDEQIFSASLLFGMVDGQPQLTIGRLQGTSSEQGRSLVRDATRDLFACRPGQLLIGLARHIAHRMACRQVLLVGNENRIVLNIWRRWRITADYDRLWLEMGAARRQDGNFQLECLASPDIDIEAVPSKRRSEARRKLAMLEALYAEVGHQFSPMAEVAEAA